MRTVVIIASKRKLLCCVWIPLLENFGFRHSGLDPESSLSSWIPAFAGMTLWRSCALYATFRETCGKSGEEMLRKIKNKGNVMLDLYEELKILVRGLQQAKIDYALCGGLALAVYGIPRATIDIDFLIMKDSLPDVQSIAQRLGYTVKATPMEFAKGVIDIHRFSKIDSESGDLFSLDFLLVTPEIDSVWQSRREVEWEDEKLWVVSREGLIALKSLRGSGQDLEDIQKLKEGTDES